MISLSKTVFYLKINVDFLLKMMQSISVCRICQVNDRAKGFPGVPTERDHFRTFPYGPLVLVYCSQTNVTNSIDVLAEKHSHNFQSVLIITIRHRFK